MRDPDTDFFALRAENRSAQTVSWARCHPAAMQQRQDVYRYNTCHAVWKATHKSPFPCYENPLPVHL